MGRAAPQGCAKCRASGGLEGYSRGTLGVLHGYSSRECSRGRDDAVVEHDDRAVEHARRELAEEQQVRQRDGADEQVSINRSQRMRMTPEIGTHALEDVAAR